MATRGGLQGQPWWVPAGGGGTSSSAVAANGKARGRRRRRSSEEEEEEQASEGDQNGQDQDQDLASVGGASSAVSSLTASASAVAAGVGAPAVSSSPPAAAAVAARKAMDGDSLFLDQLRNALDGSSSSGRQSTSASAAPAGAGAASSTFPSPQLLGGGGSGSGKLVGLCREDKAKVAKLIQELNKGQEERVELKLRLERLKQQNSAIVGEMADAKTKLAQSLDLLRKYQDKIAALTAESRDAREQLRRVQEAAKDVSEANRRERDVVTREREALLERVKALEDDRTALRLKVQSMEQRGEVPFPEERGTATSAATSNSVQALADLRATVEELRIEVRTARGSAAIVNHQARQEQQQRLDAEQPHSLFLGGEAEGEMTEGRHNPAGDHVNWWTQSLEIDKQNPLKDIVRLQSHRDPTLSLLELVEHLEASHQ